MISWDFGAVPQPSCPVRKVESIQDRHLLALKQSSAFSKVSLTPVLDVCFQKDTCLCPGCKRNGRGEIPATVTEIPCRCKRKMKVSTLREASNPWDKRKGKQSDALCFVCWLVKMRAVSPMERVRASNPCSHRSPVLTPRKPGQYHFALP